MANTHWETILEDSQQLSLPAAYLNLQQVIARENFSLGDICEVISGDDEVAERLLCMVNSGFFELESPIKSIRRAVNFLGAQQVHDLVLSSAIAHAFDQMNNPGLELHHFWQKSTYCAIVAREFSILTNLLDSERLFVIGLMHDIGHLMMHHSRPEIPSPIHSASTAPLEELCRAERDTLGFDYTMVGARLLQNWHLPEGLARCIRYQLQPASAEECQLEASILNIAVVMTHRLNGTESESDIMLMIDAHAATMISINPSRIALVDRRARSQLEMVMGLLFPESHQALFPHS